MSMITIAALSNVADSVSNPEQTIKELVDSVPRPHRDLSAEEYEAALSPSGKYIPPSDGHVVAEVVDGKVERRG